MLISDSDLTSSISPLTTNPIETLDSSFSPIASIGVQSLALDDHQPSLPTEEVSIPPLTSFHETLTVSSPVTLDHGECGESQAMQRAPDEPFSNICLSDNHNRWTPNVSPGGYDTDDESASMWLKQPLCIFNQEPPKMIVDDEEPTSVGVGLWNLGNSCFVNSVLQCLTHTVPLVESLCSYKSPDPCNCGNEWFCVVKTLQSHIEAALTNSGCSISPDYFLNNLNYFSADFRRYQQEDAHEFLQAFLDKLERCCVDRSSDSSQDDNLVQRIFGGRLLSGLRCCNCNSVSETFENSLGLSLEIDDVDNLQSALDSFTRVEKLDEPMTCDDCKEKVSKEKRLVLDKLPQVVTFHLKRFKNNGFFMEKIFNHVAFPLEIDLQPYMTGSQSNEVNSKYHLYAFVEHFGSLAYGHYSSYVRSAPKIWHQFDDKQVTRIDEDRVLSQDAYILFYAREGTPWLSNNTSEEVHHHPLVEASLQNSSPNSVLDPTNGECSSEISYENVYKLCDDSAGLRHRHVKPDEICVSLSNEFDEDVLFQSAESSGGEDSHMTETLDVYDPDDDDNSNDSCAEKEVGSCLENERATTGDQASSQKQQEGTFQIQLETEEEEEEPCKLPLLISDVRESEETKSVGRGGLTKKPSPRGRVLEQAISASSSPPKKLKKA